MPIPRTWHRLFADWKCLYTRYSGGQSRRANLESEEFLSPRLVGGRFEGNAIPLDFLRDLSALNDILREEARAAWFKANRDRKRLPNGFSEDFTLSLSGVEPGSAVPKITLFFAMLGAAAAPAVEYLRQSRENLIGGVRAAAEDRQPTDYLSPGTLAKFQGFGERLRDGEAIEFSDHGTTVRYTKEVRRKLLLAAPGVEEVSEEVELRGLVWRTDQRDKVFLIKLADGTEAPGPMAGDHYDNILEATKDYRRGAKIFLQGIGTRNRQGKLVRIDSIESSSVLDPLDIHARLEELRVLKQGWFDGEGESFDPAGMDWLESSVHDHYAPDRHSRTSSRRRTARSSSSGRLPIRPRRWRSTFETGQATGMPSIWRARAIRMRTSISMRPPAGTA